MKLVDFLEQSGWSKADVARRLGLSRAAVSGWDEVPEKWEPTLHAAKLEKPPEVVRRVCSPMDLPDDELKVLIRNRAAVSDFDLCQERGWRVPEFHEAIAGWVKRNPYKKPENGYDLSRYVKGEVV